MKELDELLNYLVSEPFSPQQQQQQQHQHQHQPSDGKVTEVRDVLDEIVLIGYSTGCQDSVFYMKHGRPDLRVRVKGVVLQAPVSDREWLALLPETEVSLVENQSYFKLGSGRREVCCRNMMMIREGGRGES